MGRMVNPAPAPSLTPQYLKPSPSAPVQIDQNPAPPAQDRSGTWSIVPNILAVTWELNGENDSASVNTYVGSWLVESLKGDINFKTDSLELEGTIGLPSFVEGDITFSGSAGPTISLGVAGDFKVLGVTIGHFSHTFFNVTL